MSSKVISEGKQNATSKLIKAMQGWDTEFYTDPPKGVFGSTATINCNGTIIKSDELDIEFTIPFDDDLEANEAEVTIYNLNDTTKGKLTTGEEITITAGFGNDTGLIFSGFIEKSTTLYEEADRVTRLKCLDRIKTNELKEITYQSGTKASAILRDLISKTGTQVAVFKVRTDHTYQDEQKVDGDLMENIKKYAEICGISVYISEGKIYARYLKDGDDLYFSIQEETGLIGSPAEYEEEMTFGSGKETIKGLEIETIMQHRFKAGGIVSLKSKNYTGSYRIRSGRHTFSSGDAVSSIKVF